MNTLVEDTQYIKLDSNSVIGIFWDNKLPKPTFHTNGQSKPQGFGLVQILVIKLIRSIHRGKENKKEERQAQPMRPGSKPHTAHVRGCVNTWEAKKWVQQKSNGKKHGRVAEISMLRAETIQRELSQSLYLKQASSSKRSVNSSLTRWTKLTKGKREASSHGKRIGSSGLEGKKEWFYIGLDSSKVRASASTSTSTIAKVCYFNTSKNLLYYFSLSFYNTPNITCSIIQFHILN